MTHPIYLSTPHGSIPLTGHIRYICPVCGREMAKGVMCPQHQRRNVTVNTFDKDTDDLLHEAAERDFMK